MREINLRIYGVVVPKQSMRVAAIPYIDKRSGEPKALVRPYQTKKVKDYEKLVRDSALSQIAPGTPFLSGAIELRVTIIYAPLKSMSKKDKQFIADGGIIYKTTQPDLTDNLIKGIADGLQNICYDNDGKICKVISGKIFGKESMAVIKLTEIRDRFDPNSLI